MLTKIQKRTKLIIVSILPAMILAMIGQQASTQPTSILKWEPKSFKKPSQEQLKKQLTKIQFEVTQRDGTEPPFKNEYWNNKDTGIYVDIISGEPLFSSLDMYDSGTGWPSFSKPLRADLITTKEDRKLFSTRTEVRSKIADSHLGHVFTDGPPSTGLRYCMNSASLRFVPLKDLEALGYGEFLPLFKNSTEGIKHGAGKTQKAIFAAGCFWCVEHAFEGTPGVLTVVSGFSGGKVPNPTYTSVSAGSTGHTEVVEVTFDPEKISYSALLDIFWLNVDPLDSNGQFCDRGSQYRPEIFYFSEEQKKTIESSLKTAKSKLKIKGEFQVPATAASAFYAAEDYHQDYADKNPVRYKLYRYNCGRDKRLRELWGSEAGEYLGF